MKAQIGNDIDESYFADTPRTKRCWRDGKWHADELANLCAKLERESDMRSNVLGRIACALFPEMDNVPDETCVQGVEGFWLVDA